MFASIHIVELKRNFACYIPPSHRLRLALLRTIYRGTLFLAKTVLFLRAQFIDCVCVFLMNSRASILLRDTPRNVSFTLNYMSRISRSDCFRSLRETPLRNNLSTTKLSSLKIIFSRRTRNFGDRALCFSWSYQSVSSRRILWKLARETFLSCDTTRAHGRRGNSRVKRRALLSHFCRENPAR